MKVQIINQAMTEEHIDNLDNEIEVLVLIDCYSDVKINNLPFGLKYLVFSYSGEYIINYAKCEKSHLAVKHYTFAIVKNYLLIRIHARLYLTIKNC